MKKVSVIIPAYNAEKYIAETLDSVVIQTYSNLEILVINDGSTDRTSEVVNRYAEKDSRIKVIYKQNGGVSSARNEGLISSKGEYICIFDSDDIMMPEKIEKQVTFFKENLDINFIYSSVHHFFDEKPSQKRQLQVPVLESKPYKKLLEANVINASTVMFKRELFERYGGFDESLKSSEDWDYWLLLSRDNKNSFGFIFEYLTLCRIRKQSLSSNEVDKHETIIQVLEKQKDYCLKNNLSEYLPIINNGLSKRLRLLKLSYVMNGEYEKANIITVELSMQWKIILLIARWLPRQFAQYLYNCIRFIKFYKNSQKVI